MRMTGIILAILLGLGVGCSQTDSNLKGTRDGNGGADGMTGDAQLIGIKITYTTDAATAP